MKTDQNLRPEIGVHFRKVVPPGGGASYTEFAQGMNYLEGGHWLPSQDLIEITPEGGASAVRGPHQAFFSANINQAGSIEQVTSSGRRLRSHPAGLFLYSPKSGKSLQIAGIKDSIGALLPPNQIVYENCFEGVAADLRLTYTKAAFESDVILKESISDIVAGEPDFAGDSTVRLEVWTEFIEPGNPRIVRRVLQEETDPQQRGAMAEPDLTDDILDFGDLLFIPGQAFATSGTPPRDSNTPAAIDLSPEGQIKSLSVARRWFEADGGRRFLIESVLSSDLRNLQASLPAAKRGQARSAASRREMAAALAPSRSGARAGEKSRVQVARLESYAPKGVVLDYRNAATSGAETIATGETVFVAGTTYLTTLTLQQGCVVKFADNAHLLASSSIHCSATAVNPAYFTSKDDDSIGDTILGSTASPTLRANPAIWVYYTPSSSALSNLRIKWAKTGMKYDVGAESVHTLSDSKFEQCTTGVSYFGGTAGLTLVGVTYCAVTTPTTGTGISGFMYTECSSTSFTLPSSDGASEKPGAMALVDLNDDHRPDLVTASTTVSSVHVRLGNADGTFATPTVISLASIPSGLAVADLNQDLRPDIVVTHATTGKIKILLGSGAGNFITTVAEISLAAGAVPVAVAVGDVDGNFTPDLVITSNESGGGKVRVLRRDPVVTGTSITYGQELSYAVGTGPLSLALADFNRDGRLDIAVANETSGTITVLAGNATPSTSPLGDGTFAAGVVCNSGVGVPTARLPRSIVAEDFDRDGFIDLAVANFGTATIAILRNQPATPGTFGTAVELPAGVKPRSIALADFDNDSISDIVIAHESGTSLLSVIRGYGSEAWGSRVTYGTATAAAFVQARDIDRDGRPDIVVSNPTGTGSYQRVLNGGQLPRASFASVVNTSTGSALDAVVVRRLTTDAGANIDANLDLAIANSTGNKVRIYAGDGNGGFTLSTDLALPIGSLQPVSIAIGDLNKNGYVDVVSAN